jgi:hypothetical protein
MLPHELGHGIRRANDFIRRVVEVEAETAAGGRIQFEVAMRERRAMTIRSRLDA